jgi:hypothetical protein
VLSFEPLQNFGPIPFRFNPLWIQNEEALQLIIEVWRQLILGPPSYVWESNLRAIKKALKKWVKLAYVPPTQERKEYHNQLEELQRNMEITEVS